MSRLKDHEVLFLIDRVVLDLDRSRALMKLIAHSRIVLDDVYDLWETWLRIIKINSISLTAVVFARGVYKACFKFDDARGVPFPLFAAYFVFTEIRREKEQILYKSHGMLRERECKYIHQGETDTDLVYDEYSCGDRCGWMDDYNKPRPCKVYYTPRSRKPNPVSKSEKQQLLGQASSKSIKDAVKNASRKARAIRYDAFISFEEDPKSLLDGKASPDPADWYMLEYLQQMSQYNPIEDSYFIKDDKSVEEIVRYQLNTLPPEMMNVMVDYYDGLDGSGLYNVNAVAQKYSLTPDDVRDVIRASIQRLKRHGMTE